MSTLPFHFGLIPNIHQYESIFVNDALDLCSLAILHGWNDADAIQCVDMSEEKINSLEHKKIAKLLDAGNRARGFIEDKFPVIIEENEFGLWAYETLDSPRLRSIYKFRRVEVSRFDVLCKGFDEADLTDKNMLEMARFIYRFQKKIGFVCSVGAFCEMIGVAELKH